MIIEAKDGKINECLGSGAAILLSLRPKRKHVFSFTHSLHSISPVVLKIEPGYPMLIELSTTELHFFLVLGRALSDIFIIHKKITFF